MFCQTDSTVSSTTASWPEPVTKRKSPGSARCLETSKRRNQTNHRMRRHHPSHCAGHAPTAAGRCASSRPSGADRCLEPERRQESRPYDEQPTLCPFPRSTLPAPVEGTLGLNAFYNSQRQPNQRSQADKCTQSSSKNPDAEPPNSEESAKV